MRLRGTSAGAAPRSPDGTPPEGDYPGLDSSSTKPLSRWRQAGAILFAVFVIGVVRGDEAAGRGIVSPTEYGSPPNATRVHEMDAAYDEQLFYRAGLDSALDIDGCDHKKILYFPPLRLTRSQDTVFHLKRICEMGSVEWAATRRVGADKENDVYMGRIAANSGIIIAAIGYEEPPARELTSRPSRNINVDLRDSDDGRMRGDELVASQGDRPVSGAPHLLAGPPESPSEKGDNDRSESGNGTVVILDERAERQRYFISGAILLIGILALAIFAVSRDRH